MSYRRIRRNHQVQILDDRGGVHESTVCRVKVRVRQPQHSLLVVVEFCVRSLLQADPIHAWEFAQLREPLERNIAFLEMAATASSMPVDADSESRNICQLCLPLPNEIAIGKQVRKIRRNCIQSRSKNSWQSHKRGLEIELWRF